MLAAKKLTTADMFNLDNERVEGIVAEEGGMSSHAAILAREHGIPAVLATGRATDALEDGMTVTVDGASGVVVIDAEGP